MNKYEYDRFDAMAHNKIRNDFFKGYADTKKVTDISLVNKYLEFKKTEEFLVGTCNTRPAVSFLPLFQKNYDFISSEMLLDNITLTGEFNGNLKEMFEGLQPDFNGWALFTDEPIGTRTHDDESEVIYAKLADFRVTNNNRIRIDISPKYLNSDEYIMFLYFKIRLLNNLRISRLDVAFDIKGDFATKFFMQHQSIKSGRKKALYMSENGHIENRTYGSRGSTVFVRQYDKAVEQGTEYGWGRFEIEIRNIGYIERHGNYCRIKRDDRTPYVRNIILDELDNLVIEKSDSLEWKERAIVHALMTQTVSFSEVGKKSAAKYRKIIKQQASDLTLGKHFGSIFLNDINNNDVPLGFSSLGKLGIYPMGLLDEKPYDKKEIRK